MASGSDRRAEAGRGLAPPAAPLSSAPPEGTAGATGHEPGEDGTEESEGGRPTGPDPQASLDQVLRHAAEARTAEATSPD